MGKFHKILLFIANYRYVLLPVVFTAFFLHLFLSKPFLGIYSASSSSSREPLLRAFYGPESFEEPKHLEPIELSGLFHGNDFKSIDDVHSKGLMHLGVFLLITDADGMVLIVRRHPEMVTCPGAWSLVGEHFSLDEKVSEAAKRGVLEELGSSVADEVTTIENIFHHPLFYTKDYLNTDGKKDRQITYVMHVKLRKKKTKIKIKPADEIVDYKWISVDEFLGWLRDDMKKEKDFDFCDKEYQQLTLKTIAEFS